MNIFNFSSSSLCIGRMQTRDQKDNHTFHLELEPDPVRSTSGKIFGLKSILSRLIVSVVKACEVIPCSI
jgi:hypothetical protein